MHKKLLNNVSPQGYLVAADQKLLLPCGRANVTCLDRDTLDPVSTSYSSRGKTDFHVVSDGTLFFHGDAVYDLKERLVMPFKIDHPVSNGDLICGTIEQTIEEQPVTEDQKPVNRIVRKLAAFNMGKRESYQTADRKGNPITRFRVPQAWTLESEEITLNNEAPRWSKSEQEIACMGIAGRPCSQWMFRPIVRRLLGDIRWTNNRRR